MLWGTLKRASVAVAWRMTLESHLLPGKSLPLFLFIASEPRSLVQSNGCCCEMVTCKKVNNHYTGDEKSDVEDL